VATWTAIVDATPINDVGVITEIIEALTERALAAGYAFNPLSLWPCVAGLTVTGVYAGDEWKVEGETHATGDGSAGPYTGATYIPPVLPGSVAITAGEQDLTDDEDGNLLDGAENVVGRIAYQTGCTRFTFPEPVDDETPILMDYTSARTTFTAGQSVFTEAMVGHKMTVEGVGEFRLATAGADQVTAIGDGTCEAAEFSVSPAGTVLNAAWWSALQGHVAALYPYFVNSAAYPNGFDGENAVVMFAANTWLPRRVPCLSPLNGTYDPETETTALEYDTEDEGWFSEGMVGALIDIFGVGQFTIVSVVDDKHATVAGDAECEYRRFSVLPQDWSDAGDPALTTGQVQAGDVLGLWLLADCQAGLKALRWTRGGTAWTDNGEQTGMHVWMYNYGSYSAAKTAAQDYYTTHEGFIVTWSPRAMTDTSEHEDPNPDPPPDYITHYNADIWRYGMKQSWGAPSSSEPLLYDLELYALPRASGTWDGNGDFAVQNKLKKWFTKASVADRSGVSDDYCGRRPPVMPNWPASDPGHRGYICDDPPDAVLKWHFDYPTG
jgi:hypothetical protein